MLHDVQPYVVHETLIEDHRFDGLRSGEGGVASLGGDSLIMVYGKFSGGEDNDRACLVARRSNDGGLHWTQPQVCCNAPDDAMNVMSASLLSLADGRLAMVYLLKRSLTDCRPVFVTSTDGGQTWSAPTVAVSRPGYYVVNNDRLVQLSTGRLVIPYAYTAPGEVIGYSPCGCTVSDDGGRTWRQGTDIRIQKHRIRPPRFLDQSNASAVKAIAEGDIHSQEPGVIELLDGRVMMWCRAGGGFMYRAYSSDGCLTWSEFEPITELSIPMGPQSIHRLPGGRRMIMLYNDRGDIPFGHPQFYWRRPMSVAVSDDEGKTWRRHGVLEPDWIASNCYYSILPHGDNLVFTYYEGVMHTTGTGYYEPRNLASLKLKIVRRKFFEL